MMTKEDRYRKYAEKIKIFHGLTPDEVRDILHRGQILQYRHGDTVFHEGTLGSNIFVVLDGIIEIFVRNKLIARCNVGDAFGEMAVLNHRPRNATAVALSDAKLFTLDESQINSLLEQRVAVRILLNIIHILSERLELANTRLADLRRKASA